MSLPSAWSHACVQLDPVTTTCTAGSILPKRTCSLPLKRHRPFSSPRRSGSCVLTNAQARPAAVAASVVADTARTNQQTSPTSSQPGVDDRLRQLEASYKAQSAAELMQIELQPRSLDASSDTEGTFTQLERSWQAQAEASTSGRSSAQSSASFAARFPSRTSNIRSNRRSSRLYAASTRRNQPQDQGVARPVQTVTGCPDTQFCSVIRERLKREKQTRRISRSEHLQLITAGYSCTSCVCKCWSPQPSVSSVTLHTQWSVFGQAMPCLRLYRHICRSCLCCLEMASAFCRCFCCVIS